MLFRSAALGKYNKAKKVKLDVATRTQKIVLNDADATLDKLKAETVIFVDEVNNAKKVDVVLGLPCTERKQQDTEADEPQIHPRGISAAHR